MTTGEVIAASDHGTIWQLFYETADGVETVHMDHRSFAHFYEGVTGSNFYRDYRFGQGRQSVAELLKGIRISDLGL